jgi:hypothetical protein
MAEVETDALKNSVDVLDGLPRLRSNAALDQTPVTINANLAGDEDEPVCPNSF